MTDRIPVQCSACNARLSVADESKLGKKIRCPKCSEVFVATAIKPAKSKSTVRKPKTRDEFDLDETEMEDAYEPRTLPPVRSKNVARKNAASAQSFGLKLPLLIAGSVLAIGLAVGGFLFFHRNGDNSVEIAANSSAAPAAVDSSVQTAPQTPSPQNTPGTLPSVAPTQTSDESQYAEKFGETKEIIATNSDSFPVGVSQITGRTRWDWRMGTDMEGKTRDFVLMYIDIRGDIVSRAIAVGKAEITRLTSSPSGSPFEFNALVNSEDPSMYYDFVVNNPGQWRQPKDTIRMSLHFVAPPEPATVLAEAEGTVTVKVGRLIEEISIPDLRTAANKPFRQESLFAAHAELFMKSGIFQGRHEDVADFRFSPKYAVGPLNITSSTFPADFRRDYKIDPNGFHYSTRHLGGLPQGQLSMTFKLYGDIEEVVVPFQFKNMPLPNLEKKPKR